MSKILSELPVLDDVEVAFSCLRTDPRLLAEARSLSDLKRWEEIASSLFFNGGKLKYKDDLSEDNLNLGSRYLRAILSSFEPKHEDKISIAALILSELISGVEVSS